jgi:hypothetical protein
MLHFRPIPCPVAGGRIRTPHRPELIPADSAAGTTHRRDTPDLRGNSLALMADFPARIRSTILP